MATFRNSQIEDILNDERKLNRVILDRTSKQVAAIGDERLEPSIRDIKIESTLGTRIDAIKEDINKAIQLISGFQYGKLDENRVNRLFKLGISNERTISDAAVQKANLKASAPPTYDDEEEDGDEEDENEGEDDGVVA